MVRRILHPPTYQFHRSSGQARVRIDGRDHYLGTYGSPESHERYQDLIHTWRLHQCESDHFTHTIDDLALLYLAHAKQHYHKDDRETSEVHCTRSALRFLVATAGPKRARDFGPKLLKEVRDQMVSAGCAARHPPAGPIGAPGRDD